MSKCNDKDGRSDTRNTRRSKSSTRTKTRPKISFDTKSIGVKSDEVAPNEVKVEDPDTLGDGHDISFAEEEEELENSEYETDIEEDIKHEQAEFDPSGKARYLRKCKELGIVPVSYFLSNPTNTTCDLKHHSLGPKGTQAVAGALMHNNCVSQLLMRDNAIQSEGSVYLAKLLQENYNITELDLSQNELGSFGARAISGMLKENDSLRVLNLARNSLKDRDATELAEALIQNSRLRDIDLSHNKFGEKGGLKLGAAIDANTGLKTLDLSWNHLRSQGAVAIARGLAWNCCLHTLLLAWNGFGDDGACAVARALEENKTLQEIDLSYNRISLKGCLELAKGLKVNTTLKTLRIGRNPISSEGAKALLTAIRNNAGTAVETLDLDGVVIEQDAQAMLSGVLKVKPKFDITCQFSKSGGQLYKDLENAFDRRHQTDKCSTEYFVRTLKDYVKSKNLRLLDLFNQFDKDKSMSVSRDELKQGFKSINLPLSDKQLDGFIRALDIDGDGEIDYNEFTWINGAD